MSARCVVWDYMIKETLSLEMACAMLQHLNFKFKLKVQRSNVEYMYVLLNIYSTY